MRLLASTILLPAILWAATPDLRTAERFYGQARYSEALQAVTPVSDRDGGALFLAGRAAYGLGDYRKATDFLEKAVALQPADSARHLWLGRAFGRRAETSLPFMAPRYASRARQSFEKAVQLDPANGDALGDLFEYYLQAPGFLGGGLDKAKAILPKFRAIGPADYEFASAKLAEAEKDFAGAEQYLLRAVKLMPKSAGRVLDVAGFLSRQGRFQESVPWLDRAKTLAPGDPEVLYRTAEIYIESRQNLSMARTLLQEYLRANLNPDLPSRTEAEKLLKKAGG